MPVCLSQFMCKSKFQTNAHGCYVSPLLPAQMVLEMSPRCAVRETGGMLANSIIALLSLFAAQSLPGRTLRLFAQESASNRHSGKEHHHPREDPVLVALLGGTDRARALGALLPVPPWSLLLRQSRRKRYRLDGRAGSGQLLQWKTMSPSTPQGSAQADLDEASLMEPEVAGCLGPISVSRIRGTGFLALERDHILDRAPTARLTGIGPGDLG